MESPLPLGHKVFAAVMIAGAAVGFGLTVGAFVGNAIMVVFWT